MAQPPRPFSLPAAALAAALLAAAPPAARAAEPAEQRPIVLAAPASLAAAAAEVEAATGAKGERLPFGDLPLAEGRSFAVEAHTAQRLLVGSHEAFRRAGYFLFRYERSYGMAGDKDRLGLVKGTDDRAMIRRVGTGSAVKGLGSEKVVAWLDALAKDEPFDLWEVGVDYVAGRFVRTPKDPEGLARRCAEIAPELVRARAADLELLAREIEINRTLYLIW